MWLKVVITLLFIANLATLGRAFYTLMVDQGSGDKRTAKLLGIRVSLAALLIAFVAYGVWSGELGLGSPWHTPQP